MRKWGWRERNSRKRDEPTQIYRGKKEYSVFRLEQMVQHTRSILRVGMRTGGVSWGDLQETWLVRQAKDG